MSECVCAIDRGDLNLLVGLVSRDLGRLLCLHEAGTDASRRLLVQLSVLHVARALVRVPQLLVDSALGSLTRFGVGGGVARAWDGNTMVAANVAVGVRHARHHWSGHVQRVHVSAVLVSAAWILNHGCGVLVSDGCLSRHHLLVLEEILLALVSVLILRIMLLTDGNHSTVLVVTAVVLLALIQILSCRVPNEDDVALVDSCRVRARMRPLLVAASKVRSAAVVRVHLIAWHITVAEAEERRASLLLLTRSRREVSGICARIREVAFEVSTQLLTIVLGHVVQLELLLDPLVAHTAMVAAGDVAGTAPIHICW